MEDKALVKSDFDRIAMIQDKKWDHNRHYHKYLLKHLRSNIQLSLEIGCGKGEFANLLAERSERVLAIDLSEKMISMAKASITNDRVEFMNGDIMELELENNSYDCIACIATAHHLPMKEFLIKAKHALKDNGVLLILDLYQEDNAWDTIISALVVPLNIIMMMLIEGRLKSSEEEIKAWREHGAHDKYLTLKQIKTICNEVIPGAKIKRHFYWRYSIIWRKEEN